MGGVGAVMFAALLPVPAAEAYNTLGCRQRFVDVNGVREIRFDYYDPSGYITLSPNSANRWNERMGPPQRLVRSTTNHSILTTVQNLGSAEGTGLTSNGACQNGYFSGISYSYVNSYWTDSQENGARYNTMVHEIGHALGLAHNNIHGNCDQVQIMYFTQDSYWNCGIQYPKSDDIAGVNAIY